MVVSMLARPGQSARSAVAGDAIAPQKRQTIAHHAGVPQQGVFVHATADPLSNPSARC
jgi:hypothetical protein